MMEVLNKFTKNVFFKKINYIAKASKICWPINQKGLKLEIIRKQKHALLNLGT